MIRAHTPYQGLEVLEQRTQLIAPHNGGKLTFLHPPYGPNIYANVGLAITRDNLNMPTMSETASLVHAAFNSPEDDRYRKEIEGIMRDEWLLAFTGTLYIPKEGAFIQDNPEIREGMTFMDKDSLEQKLSGKDHSVRYVPFGYKVGEMSPLELAKNAYFVGLAGEQGAERLARIADKYDIRPCLWSFESVDKNVTRVSALGSWDLDRRFGVVGDGRGGGRDGRAFGVLKETGGASRAEK